MNWDAEMSIAGKCYQYHIWGQGDLKSVNFRRIWIIPQSRCFVAANSNSSSEAMKDNKSPFFNFRGWNTFTNSFRSWRNRALVLLIICLNYLVSHIFRASYRSLHNCILYTTPCMHPPTLGCMYSRMDNTPGRWDDSVLISLIGWAAPRTWRRRNIVELF